MHDRRRWLQVTSSGNRFLQFCLKWLDGSQDRCMVFLPKPKPSFFPYSPVCILGVALEGSSFTYSLTSHIHLQNVFPVFSFFPLTLLFLGNTLAWSVGLDFFPVSIHRTLVQTAEQSYDTEITILLS